MLTNIKIKRLHPDAILPAYANGPEDAGMDLCAVSGGLFGPGCSFIVPTGIAIELPVGFEAQIRPRSGLAAKHNITVNFGTIDPGYRGEISVIMFNLGRESYYVGKGDKIAQLVIAQYETVNWIEYQELSESVRGNSGFGSSGK